jgi:hypothetical protein
MSPCPAMSQQPQYAKTHPNTVKLCEYLNAASLLSEFLLGHSAVWSEGTEKLTFNGLSDYKALYTSYIDLYNMICWMPLQVSWNMYWWLCNINSDNIQNIN